MLNKFTNKYFSKGKEFEPQKFDINSSYSSNLTDKLKDGLILSQPLDKSINISGCINLEKMEPQTLFMIVLTKNEVNKAWEIFMIATQMRNSSGSFGDRISAEIEWADNALARTKCEPTRIDHMGQLTYHICPRFYGKRINLIYESTVDKKFIEICEVIIGAEKKEFELKIHSHKHGSMTIEEKTKEYLELSCQIEALGGHSKSHIHSEHNHFMNHPDSLLLNNKILNYEWYIGTEVTNVKDHVFRYRVADMSYYASNVISCAIKTEPQYVFIDLSASANLTLTHGPVINQLTAFISKNLGDDSDIKATIQAKPVNLITVYLKNNICDI
ncbi:unnamed protein product [Gordionus sp. m RMFG-2023]